MTPQTLLVIIRDRLSELVSKGSLTPRYYNPGNLFQNVHILMVNDDQVNLADIQDTAGDADLFVHNLPMTKHMIRRSLAYRPAFLTFWAQPAIELAKTIKPQLIRCHGDGLNAYIAACIKERFGIPFVVSMHTNPDDAARITRPPLRERFFSFLLSSTKQYGLQRADIVLPVYQSIIPYLKRRGIENYEVVYNFLNETYFRKKEDFHLHSPVRIISVGRQIVGKEPHNIIRAIDRLPNTTLLLVGDGSHHADLRNLVEELDLRDRVEFQKSIPNNELCSILPEFDIFAVHLQYAGISKTILEALLTGLPVVINRRLGEPVPELEGDFVLKVNNTVEEYAAALKRLIEDDGYREQLGRRAYEHAQEHWSPKKMEARVVEIYRKLMKPA